MAGKLYAIGDLHKQHKKIWPARGFGSMEDHDWAVFKSLMEVCKRGDSLMCLGDLGFVQGVELVQKIFEMLVRWQKENGHYQESRSLKMPFSISVAQGNHDSRDMLNALLQAGIIVSYNAVIERTVNDHKVVFSHIPMHPYCLDRWAVNVHAHLHKDTIPNDKRFMCVSWEQYRKPKLVSELLTENGFLSYDEKEALTGIAIPNECRIPINGTSLVEY